MKRLYRELNPETKQKISQSMKNYHNNVKTTEQARSTASKLSSSLKKYWDGVPSQSTMQDYLRGNTQ